MIILIDMDDVLADFDGSFLRLWRETYPNEFFIPLEKRKEFYMRDEYPEHLLPAMTEMFTKKDFVAELTPVDGALDAIIKIKEKGHEVFICTSPMRQYHNCVCEKYIWVEKHLGFEWTKRLILTRDKTLIQGDILIDDKPEITGAYTPVWEHILFDRAYNKQIKNKRRIDWFNWQSVLTEI